MNLQWAIPTLAVSPIVFSTKDRIPYLREETRHDVFAYLGGIARETGLRALNIGGYEDHAHLLLAIPASICIADEFLMFLRLHKIPYDERYIWS
jgi:hypothetical protein